MPKNPYGITLQQEQPAVSFDIRLGQTVPPGMQLSFDSELYSRLIAHMEPNDPKAWEQAQIEIKKPKKGQFATGHYDPLNTLATITYTDDTDASNVALVHETRHFLDHRNGILNTNSLVYPAAWMARLIGLPAAVALFATEAIVEPSNHWAAYAALGSTAIYIAGMLSRTQLRVERRGYRAERFYGPIPIMSLEQQAN